MDVYSKIKRRMKNITTEERREVFIYPAQVEAVSGRTCSVRIDETLTVTDVRLRAVINTNAEQVLLTPKAGSYVLVVDLSGGNHRDLAVIACSEVEEVNIRIGNTTAVINAGGMVFNGGENGGMVKLQELQDNLDSLKQYVEAINSALPSAFSAVGAGTAANGATGATSYQGAMAGQTVHLKDMENEKIKQ
jgi:hypothetical protein